MAASMAVNHARSYACIYSLLDTVMRIALSKSKHIEYIICFLSRERSSLRRLSLHHTGEICQVGALVIPRGGGALYYGDLKLARAVSDQSVAVRCSQEPHTADPPLPASQ